VAFVEANTELGRQVVADAKRYVLHSYALSAETDDARA
jgi:hypothetical protein